MSEQVLYAQRVDEKLAMPIAVTVRFAHATAQAVADAAGVRLLHIKGPALDESLLDVEPTSLTDGLQIMQPVPRHSVDADVWVSPSDMERFIAAMVEHGWTIQVEFMDGSAFEHAATLRHPRLGHVDVHRRFPGIRLAPQLAFDRLWLDCTISDIAGIGCTVPSLAAQRLVLLLHAARGGIDSDHPDVRRTWTDAHPADRESVRHLAYEIEAEVALAAGIGELHRYRGAPDYWLWRILSTGADRYSMLTLWAARVRAEKTGRDRISTAIRLVLPKPQRLRLELGRPPTRREVMWAYVARVRLAAREAGKLLRGHR